MDVLFWLLAFVVVMIPLVIIHEFGHLLACKMVGISVTEFGIGFPPRALKLFQWGETEFTLNWVPLGGFVMPFGEDMMKPETEEAMEAKRQSIIQRDGERKLVSVHAAKPWQKIWFLSAGALANIVAAFVLFTIVPLVGYPIELGDVIVSDVLPDSPAVGVLQEGDHLMAFNGTTLESGTDLIDYLQDFLAQNPNQPIELTVKRDGATQNITITPENDTSKQYVRVIGLQEDSPAIEAGLQPEDFILVAADEPITSLEQLQGITAEHDNRELPLQVFREGQTLEVVVVPEKMDGSDDPARMGISISIIEILPTLGVWIQHENVRWGSQESLGLVGSVKEGASTTAEVFEQIVTFPVQLIRGDITLEEARPASVVAIAQIGGEIIQSHPYQDLITFTAIISIALAFTNLLPIPALDGGRILFVLIEIIRGRPMEPEREGIVHLIGFALLLVLMVFLIINDVLNPSTLTQ